MKYNFDQQMQMLTPDFQQRFYDEQKKEWDGLVFNVYIPLYYRLFALAFETPVSLNVHAEYFKWFMQTPEIKEMNMSDAVTFCRAANRTFMQYLWLHGKTAEAATEYGKYIDFVEAVTNQVNEVVEPIKDKVFRKMQALQNLQLKNGNRTVELS